MFFGRLLVLKDEETGEGRIGKMESAPGPTRPTWETGTGAPPRGRRPIRLCSFDTMSINWCSSRRCSSPSKLGAPTPQFVETGCDADVITDDVDADDVDAVSRGGASSCGAAAGPEEEDEAWVSREVSRPSTMERTKLVSSRSEALTSSRPCSVCAARASSLALQAALASESSSLLPGGRERLPEWLLRS